MAMSIGAGQEEEPEVMASINTTPLVDVMLVLLIIFLITIPVVIQSVPVQLPRATNQATITKPENISIAVDREGNIYWNQRIVPTNQALLEKVKEIAVLKPQPEVHVRADRETRFENVGRVIVTAQRGGIAKVGFITEPEFRGR
ncbi:MAG: biopolymer transporter ExbD [Gammaproteobacteria bacterium]|nr:biopolymer transporter ExbD [Gammaproteobacteria bacterium]